MLALKPVLTVGANGSLEVFKKISGKKKALAFLAERCIEELDDQQASIYVIDADSQKDGDALAEVVKQAYPNVNVVRQQIGPVIGTHCGPGTVGIIFAGKQRPIALANQD